MTGMGGSHDPTPNDAGESMSAAREPENIEARKAVHNAIDAALDEIVWRARERLDRSDTIATHRAAIHDAVREYRDTLLASSLRAPQRGPWRIERDLDEAGNTNGWWVINSYSAHRVDFSRHDEAEAVRDALNALAGSGAETPPQPETKP